MKIAVIGAGWWGKNIINTFEQITEIESVIYFDQNPEVREKFKLNKKSHFTDSIESILENPGISAVCIATPPSSHFILTQKALLSGKHVFVEKPPAFTASEIQELGDIAVRNGLVYMLDALFLFMEPVKKLKEIISSGLLEEIRHVDMYRVGDELRREGAGIQRITKTMFQNNTDVVEDLFFHDAGILLNLFNNLTLQSVKKFYHYHPALCDSAEISFSTSAFPVTLSLSWVKTGRRRGLSLYDRNFILEYDGLKQENQVSVYNLWKNSKEEFTFLNNPPLQAMLEYFIDTINNKTINSIDFNFMKKIIGFWEEINHAK